MIDPPDDSGNWMPLHEPGRSDPIGWANPRTGKTVYAPEPLVAQGVLMDWWVEHYGRPKI